MQNSKILICCEGGGVTCQNMVDATTIIGCVCDICKDLIPGNNLRIVYADHDCTGANGLKQGEMR